MIAALDAKSVENRSKTHAHASDWYLADLHEEIPTYACFPNLAWQAVAESDLAGGTYSNYTASGGQIHGAGETIALAAEMAGGTRWNVPDLHGAPADPESPQPAPLSPRMGLLFLARGGLNQPGCWEQWLDAADGGVRGFAHIKAPENVNEVWFQKMQIADTVETAWADISLVRAMLALLREAIKDPTLSHFTFASESCIPIKSWEGIRKRLILDGRSMIALEESEPMKEEHLRRFDAVPQMDARCRQVHPQWVMLNREAAECLLENDFTEQFADMFAPDEHYIGCVLAMKGYPMDETHILRKCSTWVRRQEISEGIVSPEEFTNLTPSLRREWLDFPGFFARKISRSARLPESF